MDENYDEFGNYIGPDLPEINDEDNEDLDESKNININNINNINQKAFLNETNSKYSENDEENEEDISDEKTEKNPDVNDINNNDIEINPNQIITEENKYNVTLNEEKELYKDADELFPNIENLVMEEDAQPITVPIIAPKKENKLDLFETKMPDLNFNLEFLSHLMTKPNLIRNIAVVGSLLHGKTTFMDMFIHYTHNNPNVIKYLDNREDEQKRNISLKSSPISLVLQNSEGKSFLFNFIDTPGHSNFFDEVQSALRMVDGAIIVIDVLEGITLQTEKVIKQCIKENLDIIVLLNKIDRFILELKIPPNDAYFKIKFIIDEFNKIVIENEIYNMDKSKKYFIHPNSGNVLFGATKYNVIFSLESFANKLYTNKKNKNKLNIDYKKFAKLLYGDIYYNEKTNKFTRDMSSGEDKKRTFIKFILEPLYKIIGYSISEEKDELIDFLTKGFNLNNFEINQINFKADPNPLLTQILTMVFGHYSSMVDLCTKNICDSETGSKRKISSLYTGNRNTSFYNEIMKSSPEGPLICCVYKLYHKYDHLSFDLFGRVLSGTLKQKMKILIMGENYSLEETEDSYINEIKILQIHQTRYKININKVPLGNFVLIDGSDVSLSKNLTIVEYDKKYLNEIAIFKPLLFDYSFMKVSVEPLNPLDLPKMVDGLRKINQSYPASKTKVEESGENIIMGTGELYFDNILNDLRNIYSDIEIKVSDPVVNFKETILETSSFKCNSSSLNNKNKIGIIAEPMNTEVVHDLNYEQIEGFNLTQGKTRLENLDIFKNYLINEKKWDKLTTNSIWAFNQGSNILIDYTLPMENDTKNLNSVKNEIIQGFDWTCKEGPLINEPIVNSKFKILSSEISQDPVYKGSSQIIPMVRRACYSSFVTACPRLMEPMLIGEAHCTYECIRVIEDLLLRRRGHINSQIAMPGTPFYIVRFVLPALDSFGLEIDIRTTTAGQAFAMMWFNGFQTMQGDPLDKNIHYFPLEPSTNLVLAREVLIKTRRRKGLNEDINILNYLDEEGINNIKLDDEYKNYI